MTPHPFQVRITRATDEQLAETTRANFPPVLYGVVRLLILALKQRRLLVVLRFRSLYRVVFTLDYASVFESAVPSSTRIDDRSSFFFLTCVLSAMQRRTKLQPMRKVSSKSRPDSTNKRGKFSKGAPKLKAKRLVCHFPRHF